MLVAFEKVFKLLMRVFKLNWFHNLFNVAYNIRKLRRRQGEKNEKNTIFFGVGRVIFSNLQSFDLDYQSLAKERFDCERAE